MSMDWLLWVIIAIIIIVGIIMAIMVGKRKWKYYFGIIIVGITVFTMGIVLLIVSFITDLSLFYALYLIAAGAIGIIISLIVRNIREKNR